MALLPFGSARAQGPPAPQEPAAGLRLGEVLRYLPLRGRSYADALDLVPGATDVAPRFARGGDAGVSIAGATGAENAYLIDGLNTTDPTLGILGTRLHLGFVRSLTVYSGAYPAEVGRASGGVIQVQTAEVGNAIHGSVFGAWLPAPLVAATTFERLGSALAVRSRAANQGDVGFDLGGALLKDRLFFYVGGAATFANQTRQRVVNAQIFDPDGTGARRFARLGTATCPSYLADPVLCTSALGAFATTEVHSDELAYGERLYNGVARLTLRLHRNHDLSVQWLGAPSTDEAAPGSLLRELATSQVAMVSQVHDVLARYQGRALDGALRIEVSYGFHHQSADERPSSVDSPVVYYNASASNPYSLYDFENIAACARQARTTTDGARVNFNPCPLTSYARGGYGEYGSSVRRRHAVTAAVAYTLRALGLHDLRAGLDLEHVTSQSTQRLSGTDADPNNPTAGRRVYRTNSAGTSLQIAREFSRVAEDGSLQPLDEVSARGSARDWSFHLRDRFAPSFAPGLAVHAGVRWDLQEMFGPSGERVLFLRDNIAPRLGVSYDWTRKGRSLLYANYGRFYPTLPLALIDNQFNSLAVAGSLFSGDCPNQRINPASDRAVPVPQSVAGSPCTFNRTAPFVQSATVAPDLHGPYINEVLAGYRHDVGLGILLGAQYRYRAYGEVIEDLSEDGGSSYQIANPGSGQTADTFPRAERTYHAATFTVERQLESRFALLGSYTYSRSYGNYPGWYNALNGQLAPGASSQFDLIDLLVNRSGPLPTDRPHNLKLAGVYAQPIGAHVRIIGSLVFTAISGRPINVLAAHPYYGAAEVYLLPPGAGGRTPTVTQLDLGLRYEHTLPRQLLLTISLDVLNLLNQRAVTNVDDEYTSSLVSALVGGELRDLSRLRTTTGALPVLNSNYGSATAYQAPLALRLGARLAF